MAIRRERRDRGPSWNGWWSERELGLSLRRFQPMSNSD
ncbi:hypothetical protein FQN60_015381 [Etheostoma spectabile]|uniref:Uncharacterized protein n=1 Tax=Etheostoma spectabile TaxID=54343 RepID=A0A5J5CQ59_9PERO|nr:hypothetical protein FQN60_015381 [Etheostoma spectabile]